MMMKIRLQKYLANNGIASRRKSEELITFGKVKINNIVVTKLGIKIDPSNDIIKVNDRVIDETHKKVYILLNKPKGYLCTQSDPFGRPTIYDLLKDIRVKINYAGRLDYLSEGLVFLTNDGDCIYKLTHPKKKILKTYVVKVKGFPGKEDLERLEQGIPLTDNFTTSPCKVILTRKNKNSSILKFIIHEGKKRQIRRMLSHINFQVISLKRIQIGELTINKLKKGQYRFLTRDEIDKIKKGYILYYKDKEIVITIDGPAGSGKSTIARILAKKIDYKYFNTGGLYRYVTYCALKKKLNIQNSESMDELSKNIVKKFEDDKHILKLIFKEGSDIKKRIHSPEIDKNVSLVAQHISVRKNLIPLQRLLAKGKSVVMEGRDIGSVILPNADLKIYLFANEKTRISRRYKELHKKGYKINMDEVKSEIIKRDKIDSSRSFAPLVIPKDAIVVDTSEKSIEEVINIILNVMKKQGNK